jgi:3-oxoacyl-(acyl-carrier-protein) synthase
VDKIVIAAARKVSAADLRGVEMGPRFGRLDLQSQLALVAVEGLGIDFDRHNRDRIGIALGARFGSLATDLEYWNGRNDPGGPSPTLFAYTLPSAAIGEIAIRHRLTGPNLCFVGSDAIVLSEAGDLIRRGEADGCLCISCNVVTASLSKMINAPLAATAAALFLQRAGDGPRPLRKNDCDIEFLCDTFRA